MKIYALTGITNSYSMGYYSYIASIKSWNNICEKVIVIDGGSNDGSLEKLDFNSIEKLETINNDTTFWSKDYFFHISQLNIGFNEFIKNADCDWLIVVNADYVYDGDKKNISRELEKYSDELVVKFKRYKSNANQIKYDNRGIIINLKKARNKNIEILFGFRDDNNGLSDFPIIAKEKSSFIDSNGILKTIYRGKHIDSNAIIDLECGVYGHFFFTNEQCLYKCKRWSNAISRYYGTAIVDDKYHIYQNKIFDTKKNISKNEIKSWKHSRYILKIIDKYYREDMIGAKIVDEKPFTKLVLMYYRIKKRFITKLLQLNGMPSIEKLHKWVPVDSELCEPSFDLREVYEKQDKLYKKFQSRVF